MRVWKSESFIPFRVPPRQVFLLLHVRSHHIFARAGVAFRGSLAATALASRPLAAHALFAVLIRCGQWAVAFLVFSFCLQAVVCLPFSRCSQARRPCSLQSLRPAGLLCLTWRSMGRAEARPLALTLDARFGVAYAHRKSTAARLFLATHSHHYLSFIP